MHWRHKYGNWEQKEKGSSHFFHCCSVCYKYEFAIFDYLQGLKRKITKNEFDKPAAYFYPAVMFKGGSVE